MRLIRNQRSEFIFNLRKLEKSETDAEMTDKISDEFMVNYLID